MIKITDDLQKFKKKSVIICKKLLKTIKYFNTQLVLSANNFFYSLLFLIQQIFNKLNL